MTLRTIVIDESGNTGLTDVKPDPSPGPSQYFCMCAAVFLEKNREQLSETLKPFRNSKGVIHMAGMNHFDKVHLCRIVAKQPVAMLGVISNKLSLNGYLGDAQKTNTHYYNKVAQYLLERVGESLANFSHPQDHRIQIEAREQKYSGLLSFIGAIQDNPLDSRAKTLRHIDRFSINAVSKKDDDLLALADIGAHAIFCTVRKDKKTHSLTETRYLKELRPVFLADKHGKIVPRGLKPIHSLATLGVDSETRDFFSTLSNTRKKYRLLSG